MSLYETVFPVQAARRQRARFEIMQYESACTAIKSMSFQDNEDKGWSQVGGDKTPLDFDETDFNTMRVSARRMYYTDPGARGIIEAGVNYVIGKDCGITTDDENPEVQEYWDQWAIANKWESRAKGAFRRLLRDGEFFLRTFKPKGGGKFQLVRFVDPAEIVDPNGEGSMGHHTFGIECDPDDIETPVNYYRKYTVGTKEEWEVIPAAEIIHIKIMVDSDVKRGMSYLIGIAPYLTKYKGWLDDRIKLNKIRHIFNLVARPQGAAAANKLKEQFPDVTGKTPVGGTADKQLPKPGSVLLAKGVDWEYANLNINASDTALDGRNIELMTGKATGFPEYITRADASNANYASTTVSESPFVKAMEAFQDIIKEPFKQICREQIVFAIDKNFLPTSSTVTTIEVVDGEEKPTETTVDTNTECTVNFQELVHRDPKEETEAYVLQINAEILSIETATTKLGYNPIEEKKKIEQERIERDKRMKANFGVGDDHEQEEEKQDDIE